MNGKEVVRPEGKLVGNLMQAWRELRDKGSAEERELLSNFEIMQQPAGFCDGIILSWITELRAEEVPQCVHVRDAFGGGWSLSSMRANFVCHSVSALIAGKMTPVCQLTDTDVAAPMKRASDTMKRTIMSEKRDIAHAVKVMTSAEPPNVECTKPDMLRIMKAGHDRVEHLNKENSMLLAGLRRNGFLHWKPDVKSKTLVRVNEVYPEMSKKFPERSHRVPDSWWRNRDSEGYDGGCRPEVPSLTSLGRVFKSENEMHDDCPAQKPDELTKLHCWDEEKKFAEFGAPEIELDLEAVDDDAMAPLQEASVRLAVSAVEAERFEAILRNEKLKGSSYVDGEKKLQDAKLKKQKQR